MTRAAAASAITTSLGTFDVKDDAVIRFPEGLPGFERCTRFVLISSEDIAPLQWLQAIDSPQPSFLVVDPNVVVKDYRRTLGRADRVRLGALGDDLLWLAIVTVSDGDEPSVNLRAPLVIDHQRMVGCQLIPERSRYRIAQPLSLG
jgi:flagellar assembly factor FliW